MYRQFSPASQLARIRTVLALFVSLLLLGQASSAPEKTDPVMREAFDPSSTV